MSTYQGGKPSPRTIFKVQMGSARRHTPCLPETVGEFFIVTMLARQLSFIWT
jgi:hypothetical protein